MICNIVEYMQLSETELKILQQIANGNTNIKEIAENIDRDVSIIYRTKNVLMEKNFLEISQNILKAKKITHITLLLQLLIKYPNIINILSGSGILILTEFIHPATVGEIASKTGFKKSVIYKKIKQAANISAVVPSKDNRYVLNEKIWEKLKEFLIEYKKYEEITDARIPANSIIYHKNKKEILFSNNEDLDASLTGFSIYKKYGIKILLTTKYYFLPKKTLSKKEVFKHSLQITQKEKNIRNLTFICLFYLKNKHDLSSIKHYILDEIKQVIKGKKIQGYPTLGELRAKAELYDIRI